jgi:hypothetical protein
MCANLVLHRLTDEQKQRRFISCQGFIQTCQDNPSFLDWIVTVDESWVFKYDPEMKRQSIQWTSKSSSKSKNFFCKSPWFNPCWSHIFDRQVVTHKQFVPKGPTGNRALYFEIIETPWKLISRLRPQFRAEGGSWFLLQDNDLSHSALAVKIFLAKHGAVEMSHPPYSPYHALADFLYLSYCENWPQRKEVSPCWRH